ncbi:outer membrane beta-barrel protein [Rhodocytophaga aerolata]|uniref:Outer membrane beta-barrel protein n=1 Tax=Rhodocytophaga aerolata TaxID=455078 RepID=A0ABT8R265_9BACT|nr:outer membrane beta-barrel protein [Rhodocytophaga aerolata]MDO1445333.1 outer membrane beta-barrel protein [Rhodocytophaga aerolata]
MKLLNKVFYICLLICLVNYASYAQGGYTNITYNMAMPLGSTADYISNTSFRGISLEIGTAFNENFSIGLGGSWHIFYQHPGYSTVELSNTSAISGMEYRYINALPIMAIGRYLFNSQGKFTPFIGTGVGTAYIEQRTDIGSVPFESSAWHVAVAPEVGAIVEVGYRTNLFLNARFTNAFKSGDMDNLSMAGLNLGITYSLSR